MKRLFMLLGATVALLAGSVAWATIPDPDGEIHACYAAKTFRIIDSATSDCKAGETPLEWNVVGPPGPKGDPGAPATKIFAVVFADGSLRAHSGVSSAEKVGTGNYSLTFPNNIGNCAAVATTHLEPGQVVTPAFVLTSRPSFVQVQVTTFAATGTPTDTGFELAMIC